MPRFLGPHTQNTLNRNNDISYKKNPNNQGKPYPNRRENGGEWFEVWGWSPAGTVSWAGACVRSDPDLGPGRCLTLTGQAGGVHVRTKGSPKGSLETTHGLGGGGGLWQRSENPASSHIVLASPHPGPRAPLSLRRVSGQPAG